MARIDADGFLWILGRADQAIIRGGFKVMPDDVRTALGEPSGGAGRGGGRPPRSTASAKRRSPWSNCASAVEVDTLLDYLRTRLARYEIPTDIAIVEQIPRTPSGKADLAPSAGTSATPSNMPETTVADVLREQARRRGDHPLLVCDADRLTYAEADRRSARAGPRADRARRGQGHSCRSAVSERAGVHRGDAGRGAHRRRRHSVLDVRHRP